MHSGKRLTKNYQQWVEKTGKEISPATVFVLGYNPDIFEPLMLEAIANHPGCGELYYIPLNTEHGRANFNHLAALEREAVIEELGLGSAQYSLDYKDEKEAETILDAHYESLQHSLKAYPIRALLQRHGGPPLNHDLLEARLDHHFTHTPPATITGVVPDMLINGTSLAFPVESFVRRYDCWHDNTGHMGEVLNYKTLLPDFAKPLERTLGIPITTDCETVDTIEELTAFMDRVGIDRTVLKRPVGVGGQHIYRVFREGPGQPLMSPAADWGKTDSENPLICLDNTIFKSRPMLAMRWLDPSRGDLRVLVRNGHYAGAYLRHHKSDDWRCNTLQGGALHPVDWRHDVTAADRVKIGIVAGALQQLGINRAAIDWLADTKGERFLSEINVGCTQDLGVIAVHDGAREAAHGRISPADQWASAVFEDYRHSIGHAKADAPAR